MNLQDKIRTGQYVIDPETKRIEFLDIRFYWNETTQSYYPSVTTVLGLAYPKPPELLEWMKRNGENSDAIRDAAGVSGSIIHGLIEDYYNGAEVTVLSDDNKPKYNTKEWSYFEKFVDYDNRFEPEVLHMETKLVSAKYGVGGTSDAVIKMPIKEGKKTVMKTFLVDYKSSNSFSETFFIQTHVYKRMWQEIHPELQIDGTAVLWLNAKTRTEGKPGDIQGKGWEFIINEESDEVLDDIWNSTKVLFDRKFQTMKPNNLSYSLSHKRKQKIHYPVTEQIVNN